MALESYAVSLYTFLQNEDARRLERLMDEGARLDLAGLVAIAFHEPKKLSDAHDSLKRKLSLVPSRDDALKRAVKLLPRAIK